MSRKPSLLRIAVAAALASVAIPAAAQSAPTYTVIETHPDGTTVERVYATERAYVAGPAIVESGPPILVERRRLHEDQLITEAVKEELAADPRLDPSRIAVETERNVVQLSGLVSTPGQARIAARDAQRVEGVAEVRNYIRPRVGDASSY